MKTRFLTAILLLTSLAPLRAQEDWLLEEVSLFAVAGDSRNPELPSPMGVGVRSTWNFGRSWLFRFSYQRVTEELEKVGLVCLLYAPNIGCDRIPTHSQMALAGIRGELLRTVVVGNRVRLGFGGGLSFNDLNASIIGEDGRRADLLTPRTGLVGYLGVVSADLILHPGVPFWLTGGFNSHWVHFRTCSGEEPPQYDPFCKITRIRELELGLAYAF